MRLAIASTSTVAYSETFVKMQMGSLPCKLSIYGRPVASQTEPGGVFTTFQHLRGLLDPRVYTVFFKSERASTTRDKFKTALGMVQAKELRHRLRENNIEAVLANFGPCGVSLLPICRQLGIPLVVHFHGYDAHSASVVDHFKNDYDRLGREAAAIVVVSLVMMEALVELGIPRKKIYLARCGVDLNKFPLKKEFPLDPVFFGVGRFTEKKAPYLTVLAFKEVRNRFPNARLILGGGGELLETTRNLVDGLDLRDAVEFPGILSPEQVASHMQTSTAFVQHSITPRFGGSTGDREGTPVTVLEAMASGLPVVSTRHAGIGEVIENGVTGLLVEERDTKGMGEAMIKLGESPEYARQLGFAAHLRAVDCHSSDHYIESLMKIFEKVQGGRAPSN